MDCAEICKASRKVFAWCYKHKVVDCSAQRTSKKAVSVTREAVFTAISDEDFPDGAIQRLVALKVIVEED